MREAQIRPCLPFREKGASFFEKGCALFENRSQAIFSDYSFTKEAG